MRNSGYHLFCDWIPSDQEDLAAAIHVNLPQSMLAVFEDPRYKGGALLGLPQSGTLKTPTASENSLNYPWLVGMVTQYPSKVDWLKLYRML